MRQHIRDFVELVARELPIAAPVYEFGALQVEGQEGFADLRSLFPGVEYVGTDAREGVGVDRVLDLHDLDLPDGSVGTAICVETLEHVEYPRRALEEIHRVLTPGGIAVITSTMDFPIHNHPHDYWRFTPEAFKSLFRPFRGSFVGYAGDELWPHTVVGVGFKGDPPPLGRLEAAYREWQAAQIEPVRRLSALTWIRRLLTPPLLSHSGRKALRRKRDR